MKLRKQRTNNEVSLDDDVQSDRGVLPVDTPDRAPSPKQRCWASELRGIFIKTGEELRRILRTVFVLRDVEGLTINQTAEVPSLSHEAVKARLWRGRLELRERLTKYFSERTGSPRRQALRDETSAHRILGLFADCLRNSITQTFSISIGQLTTHVSPTTGSTDPLGVWARPRIMRPDTV
jgi:hypothetical protein